MAKKILVNYYHFTGSETAQLLDAMGDETSALEQAIREAEERTRDYHLPATWTATLRPDGTIMVKRYHR